MRLQIQILIVKIRFVSTAEETAEKALKSSSITPEGQVASIVKMVKMMMVMMVVMMMMMVTTQANIRTYGKFCSLFEEEVVRVDMEAADITEVIMIMMTMITMTIGL